MSVSLEHKQRMLRHLEGQSSADVDGLIADYAAAFRARNTMNEPPDISYANGLFTFKSPRTPARKYRRHAVEAMRDNLRRQVET